MMWCEPSAATIHHVNALNDDNQEIFGYYIEVRCLEASIIVIQFCA